MSCNVPIRDLDDTGVAARTDLHPHQSPFLDYEMAELTWEDGKLCLNRLGQQRVSSKTTSSSSTATDKDSWELPRANFGTLESVVDLATHQPKRQRQYLQQLSRRESDALVPCETSDASEGQHENSSCVMGSTRVDWSVAKKARLETRVAAVEGGIASVSGCICGTDHKEQSGGFGVPTASFRSQRKNITSSNRLGFTMKTTDEEEKKGNSTKLSLSTKRSRATHSQSERKRRDTINQKMKVLQKLVPNSSKTDKASILDEVIEYLKTLQAQLQMMMMSRMTMASMMMPLAMPHPFHMPMMPPMAMVMDMNIINPLNLQNPATLSPLLNPTMPSIPMAAWDAAADLLNLPATVVPPDPTGIAGCQSQPMASMHGGSL